MGELINMAAVRAQRAAGQPAPELDTAEPECLLARKPEDIAAFLGAFSWEDRARWFNNAICNELEDGAEFMVKAKLNEERARQLIANTVGDIRRHITRVLDQLDLSAPLPVDGHALRVFRVSDDPGRIRQAQWCWGSAQREFEGLVPGSVFLVLRNIAAKIEEKASEAERQRQALRRNRP